MIAIGTCTLPDGRRVRAVDYVTHEYDTTATVSRGDITITDLETEEELTTEQMNQEFRVNGTLYYLHEFVVEFGKWEYEPETLDEDS